MCEADPSLDPHGSMCFARANGRKSSGPDLAHLRRDDRGGEESYRAAANMLRKIQKALRERRALNQVPRHETPRSNASFETKHRLPAVFGELASWVQSVAHDGCFCENKITRRFCSSGGIGCSRFLNAGAPPAATA